MNHPARVVPEPGVVGLLAAVLTGVPRLDGAACIGARGRFYEAETGNVVRVRECVSVCGRCPALAECREWAAGQRNLVGVVAGKFHGSVRANDDSSEAATG
ncbi:WhiB family transcriptional regulator [Mycolicibacter kumamotonensis]|uniref:4Fe-4S Wbl-type domain-containing protein n=1 Tax=Mycolicibacter kumamotonensis TaxID=354243 RepID=A0A1B8SBD6_9MYCO|nr:WhiB family transcriptional regulator [Mycolicibacter kumamotonensis]OBY30053.1 hypothetical protein ACT18_19895 [Mycolicibacter kumamotonensis]